MLYVALMDALTPVSTLTEVNFEKLSATFIPINRVVYDQNHYFGLGPIPQPKPKMADTFAPIPLLAETIF